MEQKQKRRRPWHRLLVLFVSLLALTQTGWAYKNYTINGDPNMTFSEGKNGSGNDEYSLTNVVLPANFKFKIRVQFDDSDGYHEYGPANGKSIVLTENSREDNASGLKNEGDYITIVNPGRYSFYLAPEGSNGSAPATLYIARNVAPKDVYLRGQINDTEWSTEEKWHFRYDEVSDTYILDNVFIPAGKLFKVADADWGANNINYGVSSDKEIDLSKNSSQELEFDTNSSIKLKNDFEGRVTFHVDSFRGTATITFETPMAWYLANDWTGSWDPGTAFESKGNNTYELICNSYNANDKFKINDGTTWYVPCDDKGNAITTLQNGTIYNNLQDKWGDMILPASANGKRVVFTLKVGNDGKPATFKAEWDGYTWYAIRKYDVEQYIVFEWNKKGYYEALMPSVWKNNEFHVNVATEPNASNKLWYGNSNNKNWQVGVGVEMDGLLMSMDQNGWALKFNEGDDYEVRLYVANGEGSLPVRLEFIKIAENGMPFYPKDMTKGDFEELLNDAPTTEFFYLVGHALNNGRPSPEWQLEEDGSGKYFIDFTWFDHQTEDCGGNPDDKNNDMRLKVKLVKYVANQNSADPTTVVDFVKVPLELQTENDRYYGKAGVRARAIYDPSNSQNPLSFTYLKLDGTTTEDYTEAQYLPMVSLVGKTWLQGEGVPINIDVPKADKKFDNNWDNTSLGWQQAWIQYDKEGNPVTSRDGKKVYFNTQWPPLNPIVFTTSYTDENGEHTLELSSENLTFTQQGEPHSASYWKENRFQDVDFNCENTNEEGEDDSLYALYTVSDMWITGDFKLWTGWNASRKDDGGEGADWTWNWGHYMETKWPGTWNLQENDQYNQGYTPELATGTGTVHLGTANGDMSFSKPVHFSNVYFFLDLNHPNNQSDKHCLLYFERGAISILAEGKDYTYGMFTPELTDLDEGSKVKHITVKVYKNNEDNEFVDEIWDVEVPANTVIDSPQKFLDYFKANFTDKSTGSLLWDKKEDYASGSYYYTLEVTVENQLEGISHLSTVSNPFRIYKNAIEHTLSAAQLIELPTDESLPYHSAIAGYTHITYSSSFSNRLVAFDADGKVTKMINRPSGLSEEEVKEIYQETGKWTNKVFVRTSVPNSYNAEDMGVAKAETPEFTLEDSADSKFNGKKLEKIPGTSYYGLVINRENDLAAKTIRSTMDAQVQIEADGVMQSIKDWNNISAPDARVSYTPLIPTPRVKEAYIELYYGADNSKATDDDAKTFYFTSASGKNYQITSARYQNVREIVEIDLPNVDAAIKTAANGLFNYYFEMYGGEKETETFTLDENGSLPKVNVIPSSLFKFEDGGDCDYKFVKFNSTTTNLYDRGWNSINPGLITSLDISTDAPLDEDQKQLNAGNAIVEVRNAKVLYEEGRYPNLTGIFDVYVAMKVPTGNGNSADHVDKPEEDNLLHGDTESGRYDYYFVSVGKTADEDHSILKGFEEGDYAEDVVTVEEIKPGLTANPDGYTMTIRYNLGTLASNDAESLNAKLDELAAYIRSLQLRVSYLYPFWVEKENQNSSDRNRVAAKLTGDVLKSEATTWDLDAAITTDGILTGIDGIVYGAEGNFEVGRGYIDLHGNDGNIYSAEGARVYAGSGRAYVAPGVYVVTINGITKKVMVK